MDKDTLLYANKRIKGLAEVLEHFKENLSLTDLHPYHELCSKDNKKLRKN